MASHYWGAMITSELVWVYLKGMLIGLLVMLLFWAAVEFSSWGIRTLKNRGAKPSGWKSFFTVSHHGHTTSEV